MQLSFNMIYPFPLLSPAPPRVPFDLPVVEMRKLTWTRKVRRWENDSWKIATWNINALRSRLIDLQFQLYWYWRRKVFLFRVFFSPNSFIRFRRLLKTKIGRYRKSARTGPPRSKSVQLILSFSSWQWANNLFRVGIEAEPDRMSDFTRNGFSIISRNKFRHIQTRKLFSLNWTNITTEEGGWCCFHIDIYRGTHL